MRRRKSVPHRWCPLELLFPFLLLSIIIFICTTYLNIPRVCEEEISSFFSRQEFRCIGTRMAVRDRVNMLDYLLQRRHQAGRDQTRGGWTPRRQEGGSYPQRGHRRRECRLSHPQAGGLLGQECRPLRQVLTWGKRIHIF